MKTIAIKKIEIGSGLPKIIIPIIGKTEQNLIDEIQYLQDIDFDVLEWRIDYFENIDNFEKIKQAAIKIHHLIGHKPILFTFRTANEGGNYPSSVEFYLDINKKIIASGLIDFIDIELFIGDEYVQEMVRFAHEHNVFVIVSNHDFAKTPDKNEIIIRLRKMQNLGADISKIAVMPTSKQDVLTLLSATLEMKELYSTTPLITMSMAEKGAITRVSGEFFGSDMTFGAAKHASAPGQLNANDLRRFLTALHSNE